MSNFPLNYDDDTTLPFVNDNLNDIGGEAINATRDAVFNIETEIGLGASGTAITAANAMPTAGVTETVLSATNMGTKLSAAQELVAKISTRAMASGKIRYYIEFLETK
jgi:hypothetical protein